MVKPSLTIPLLLTTLAAPPPLSAEEYYHDFRRGAFDHQVLCLVGQNVNEFVRVERDGLRIVQPNSDKTLTPVGCMPKFKVKGDFEITVSFEVLGLEKPPRGYGNGITLRVIEEGPGARAATLARFHHPKNGQTFVTDDETTAKAGERKHDLKFFPTSANAGKLRLKRTGPSVQYLIAEGQSTAFRELHRSDFGSDDVSFVRVAGVSGMAPAALDVRIIDLRIAADSLPLPAPKVSGKSLWSWWILVNTAIVLGSGYLLYRKWWARRKKV